MAEFLIRAQASSNPAASEIGDIIIIRPDGHVWGNAECLPEYLVVKLPQIDYETVKHYKAALISGTLENMIVVKRRKWHVPVEWIEARVAEGNSVITITKANLKTQFIKRILKKLVS